MFSYPVTLTPEDGGAFSVSFKDIPEAHTWGATVEEALMHASDALESAMDFYFEDKREVPQPSKAKRGQHVVELDASLVAKVLLLNEMIRQKVRPTELARRMNSTPQSVNRLVDIHHTTKIDNIAAALRALGKRLQLEVV